MNTSGPIKVSRDMPDGAPLLATIEFAPGEAVVCGRASNFTVTLHNGGAVLAMAHGGMGIFVEHDAEALEALAHACLQGVMKLRGLHA